MKNFAHVLLAAGLTLTSVSVMAMDDCKNMNMMDKKMMEMMDKNGDGMISKSEFMAAHEMMFDHMKNNQGMIDMKDMQKMKKSMMKGGAGMSDNMGNQRMDSSMDPNEKDTMGNPKP